MEHELDATARFTAWRDERPTAFLQHATHASSQYDAQYRSMAAEILALRETLQQPARTGCDSCLEARRLLRAALVGLVGVDGQAELEQFEVVMRMMPAPGQDRAAIVDAIHALIATLPEQET